MNNGWNNWIDKFQKDYRFGAMSDENAVCAEFPNVDDPWMFTEYVYQGTQTDNADPTTTKATVDMLKQHGFDPVLKESPGGHTWVNWRNYLNEFAPMLFQ